MDVNAEGRRVIPETEARQAGIEERAPGPYHYEAITPLGQLTFYRVGDANDDQVAICGAEGSAKLVVRLMNIGFTTERKSAKPTRT